MPNYEWTCAVCNANVEAGSDTCKNCNSGASLSASEIKQRKSEFYNLPSAAKKEKRFVLTKFVFILFAVFTIISLVTGRHPIWGIPLQISFLVSLYGYAFRVAIIHRWFAIVQFAVHSVAFLVMGFGFIISPIIESKDLQMLLVLGLLYTLLILMFWLPSYRYTFKSSELWAKIT